MVCAATAVLLLDVTVVNVALPAIRADLGAGFDELEWVIDAYALTLAALLLPFGAFADRTGRRRVFQAGVGLFAISSALCGAAGDATQLDVARGIQGIGAAALFATSLALLAAEFSGPARGRALGVWGAVSGAALATGPVVGGALIEAAGWRWIFLLNLPLLAAIALGARRVPESRDAHAARADLAGAAVFALAAFALVYALIRGNADGWGSASILTALGLAAAGALAFLAIERASSAPMLDPALFRRRPVAGTAAVAFLQSIAIYPLFLFLSLYFQEVLHYGALDAGLRVLPVTLTLAIAAPIAGRLTATVALGTLMGAGLLLIGAGLLAMRAVQPGDGWTVLLPGSLIGGLGIGTISPALAAAMVGVMPPERSGTASGTANTFRQLGIAAGIAGLGAIFDHRLARGGTAGFVAGLDAVFLAAAAVAFAGAIAAVLTVRRGDVHGAT